MAGCSPSLQGYDQGFEKIGEKNGQNKKEDYGPEAVKQDRGTEEEKKKNKPWPKLEAHLQVRPQLLFSAQRLANASAPLFKATPNRITLSLIDRQTRRMRSFLICSARKRRIRRR